MGWPPDLTLLSSTPDLTRALVLSLLVLAVAMLIRAAGMRLLVRSGIEGENLLRLRATVRNLALATLVLGLFIIWAEELQTVALSLVAIAAATAIATKELLMCVVGTVYRGSMRPFSIGDRIEIQGLRGDVLDISVLGTRILEVALGPAGDVVTGRVIVLPNSLLLTQPVHNDSAEGPFVVDTIAVGLEASAEWTAAEARLLTAANAATADFHDQAQEAFERASGGLAGASRRVTPRCEVEASEAGTVTLRAHFPAPASRRGEIRQAVWRAYLQSQP